MAIEVNPADPGDEHSEAEVKRRVYQASLDDKVGPYREALTAAAAAHENVNAAQHAFQNASRTAAVLEGRIAELLDLARRDGVTLEIPNDLPFLR